MAAGDGLTATLQAEFSAGVETDVARALIDPRGSYQITNGLLADDGLIFLRGGSQLKSNADLAPGGRWVWDGWLHPGRRTLIASSDDFAVLDADDETPVNLGGSGLNFPARPVVVDDLLFIPGGTIYGGSRKAANYATGTVTTTNGSDVITGAGTLWLANVDPGMLFRIAGERMYVVEAVLTNTSIRLRDAYEGSTAGGKAYTMKALETASAPYPSSSLYATVAGRLIYSDADGGSDIDIIRFTARDKPHSSDPTDRHELADGVQLIAMEGLGNDLIAFHTRGYAVVRNMALEFTDALGALQHRVDDKNQDLICSSPAGIASYRGALVVAATDGVFLVDSRAAPVPLPGIAREYAERIGGGQIPGKAEVINDHYLLPVLNADASWEATYICRLDRPVRTRNGRYFPWTLADGAGAAVPAYAVRSPESGTGPELLAIDRTTGRVIECSDYFDTDAPNIEHDESWCDLTWISRDFATGPGNSINRPRKARLTYELVDSAGDGIATLRLSIGSGLSTPNLPLWDAVNWDEFNWAELDEGVWTILDGFAVADDGRNGHEWYSAERVRHARYRLRSSGPIARLVIKSFEMFVAGAGSNRHTRVEA